MKVYDFLERGTCDDDIDALGDLLGRVLDLDLALEGLALLGDLVVDGRDLEAALLKVLHQVVACNKRRKVCELYFY